MHDDDFTPLTPEDDAALDRLLEPLRIRRRQLKPIEQRLSLEELELFALQPDQIEPARRALLEEICLYFAETRYTVEAIQHPDPGLEAAFYRGLNQGLAARGQPPAQAVAPIRGRLKDSLK